MTPKQTRVDADERERRRQKRHERVNHIIRMAPSITSSVTFTIGQRDFQVSRRAAHEQTSPSLFRQVWIGWTVYCRHRQGKRLHNMRELGFADDLLTLRGIVEKELGRL